MESLGPPFFLFLAIIFIIWAISLSSRESSLRSGLSKLAQLDKKEIDLKSRQQEIKIGGEVLDSRKHEFHLEMISKRNELVQYEKETKDAIDKFAQEKSIGLPSLAKAFSDYFYLEDLRQGRILEHNIRPAIKAADKIRRIAQKRKSAEELYRIFKYQLEYYESLFPWLIDFKSDDVDDLIKVITDKSTNKDSSQSNSDPVRYWLTPGEYSKLSSIERNQLALERYSQKKKSPWEIGRDYERYIGYLYERDGYNIHYQGIIEGLADLGRDLIAIKEDEFLIIQCKYWSQRKTIHEKHICQLFGTTVKYRIEHDKSKVGSHIQMHIFTTQAKKEKIRGIFVTSTSLSQTAKDFAHELDISVKEGFPLQDYPLIKCNVSRKTGERIYHLPFDQQYDKTIVEGERHECHAQTVREAEDLGFRRAFRWKAQNSS